MTTLSPQQRKTLTRLAHHLDPLVIVGKQGVTDNLVSAVEENLEAHELIKIRFNDFKGEKRPLAEAIAGRTGSEVADIIGHVAILYRQQRNPEKRKIDLSA